jgi:hypothetical protein
MVQELNKSKSSACPGYGDIWQQYWDNTDICSLMLSRSRWTDTMSRGKRDPLWPVVRIIDRSKFSPNADTKTPQLTTEKRVVSPFTTPDFMSDYHNRIREKKIISLQKYNQRSTFYFFYFLKCFDLLFFKWFHLHICTGSNIQGRIASRARNALWTASALNPTLKNVCLIYTTQLGVLV